MMRCFVDSSVLFSACYSATGASRRLLEYALDEDVILVVSNIVLEETETNLSRKSPRSLPLFRELIELIPFERVQTTDAAVAQAAGCTEAKDAPIVAAAVAAEADFIVTLDHVHLIDPPGVALGAGLAIVEPGVVVRLLRDQPGNMPTGSQAQGS